MNKSSICSTTLNGIIKPKKKYKTAEDAFHAARTINKLPTTIHKFGEYKCTTCHYFHIGRTNKLTDNSGLFTTSTLPLTLPSDVKRPEPPIEVKEPVIAVVMIEESKIVFSETDFDWTSEKDKKNIKKIDSYYDNILK